MSARAFFPTVLVCAMVAMPAAAQTDDQLPPSRVLALEQELAAWDQRVDRLRVDLEEARNSPGEAHIAIELATALVQRTWLTRLLDRERARAPERAADGEDGDAPGDGVAPIEFDGRNSVMSRDEIRLGEVRRFAVFGCAGDMVSAATELARIFGKTPLATEALLVAGDHLFEESLFDEAGKVYQKVIERPASCWTSMGRYKLGWVQVNLAKSDADKRWQAAAELFEQTARGWVAESRGCPEPPKLDLRRESLDSLAFVYTKAYPPATVDSRLAKLGMSNEETVVVLDKLARYYLVHNRPKDAAPLFRKLLAISNDAEKRVDWESGLEEASAASGKVANKPK
jgi:hypothetical protein